MPKSIIGPPPLRGSFFLENGVNPEIGSKNDISD